MSKALEGAAMLGAAVGLGALMLFPGTAAFFNNPVFYKALEMLVVGGVAMEAGAIAAALTAQRGSSITLRQPAAQRQIIYGVQRVGGVLVYPSTTGSHHDQYNKIIVLAGHSCYAIEALYLDGRRVNFVGGSAGSSVRNGFAFGGDADGNTYTGPDGNRYNFGGQVFCQAHYGDTGEGPGYFDPAIHANDPSWGPNSAGDTPFLGGCTYVYLKIEYNTEVFAGEPEIRFTVHGKNDIYDPRTGSRGFSNNWALCIADVLTNATFGLNDPGSVNPAQLIAAANVCDEQVQLAAGGTEARYALNWHDDYSKSPGDMAQEMMGAASGELSRIAGEWYIWPAYWQGPTMSFGADDFAEEFEWTPYRSARDLYNRVQGTYVAANYPFNVAGNLYDRNGWYNGTIENVFPFAFQPTSYPEYAADVRHGYAADQYLNEDNGIPRPLELGFTGVCSITQAQRLAKIALKRNRYQGSGAFVLKMRGYRVQPKDVVSMTFPLMGWAEKVLEVAGPMAFRVEEDPVNEGAMRMCVAVPVRETNADIYAWSTTEEQTAYCRPALGTGPPPIPNPPTTLTVTSSAGTAVLGADGIVRPRAELTWTEPLDGYTTQIQTQYRPSATATWLDGGLVDVANTVAYIDGVVAGSAYDFRICGLRPNGVGSPWVELDAVTISLTLSVVTGSGLAPGSLIGEAFTDGTAGILVEPCTVTVGNVTVGLLPAGEVALTGLVQSRLYWVYYVDAAFAGGAVTPIATQNNADFLGKYGYFLLGSLVTPSAPTGGGGSTPGGAGMKYSPTTYTDAGSRTTTNPAAAYDGDVSTSASVSGYDNGTQQTFGQFALAGWASIALPYASTITANLSSVFIQGDDSSIGVNLTIGSASFSQALSPGQSSYTASIPASTPLNTVELEVVAEAVADPSDSTGGRTRGTARASVAIAEVFIQ